MRAARVLTGAVAVLLAGAIAGCGSGAGSAAVQSGEAGASGASENGAKIRFALDWTPNTNHTGLYVALERGYFADAGLDVEVLPFNNINPEVLVDAGQAEFGISHQDTASMAIAAGAGLISVLAVEQTWASEVAVLADRDDIESPADLDGLVFGGFDNPSETATMRGVVQAAGGTGEFETVVLATNAYEALYSGAVDFTVPYVAWQGIEAARRGIELKTFAYTDFGFPDSYQVVTIGQRDWLDAHPDEARAFVQALARGYEESIADPEGAATMLHDANAGLLTDLDLLVESQRMLAERFMLDDAGEFGGQTEQHWRELGVFLFEAGLLTDRDGKPLPAEPSWQDFFTNDYLLG
ncbi:ABC transporter substrate-binding protein [Leucobacter chinensis]|uniref:ABC transporter substrate-binding protein n=1 Tax=Leucobacter chinensis TaxID=2851010 RepID=UPI001C224EF9|nr:ABC transporter substrate-binding protein [Leucobacter chinensis]